jgi:hypothetical protein
MVPYFNMNKQGLKGGKRDITTDLQKKSGSSKNI